MRQAVLSRKAKKDFGVILAYTQKQWGVSQRLKYHDQLEERFFDLAENPQKGRQSSNIKKLLSFYHEGHHVIFYRKIRNVRILHDRMDFERHL